MVDLLKPQQAQTHVWRGDSMSDIGNIQGPGGPDRIQPVGRKYDWAVKPAAPTEGGDTVHISQMADLLSKLHDLPDVRIEKVAPIRAAIQAGTYDINTRLDLAIERLLEDLE